MEAPQVSQGAPVSQKVSDNPLDYLAFIVYVKRNVPICAQLQAQLGDDMEVMIQDVDSIQGARPPWLKGVPTVVRLPGREVLTGTAALEALQQRQTSIRGVESSGAAPAAITEPQSFSSLFTMEDPPIEDARYQDKSAKLPPSSLEELMRRRG